MTKIDYSKVITETTKKLQRLEKGQHKAFVRDRIRFLWLLKSGRCSSQIQAGELIGLRPRSSQRLWQQYQKGGLEALLCYPYQTRYFFFDEMRTGTRTELKRRWTPQGHRPVCRIKLGYEFTYIYAALAPVRGYLIALLLPDMRGESFHRFMQFFEAQVKMLYPRGKVLLVLDQASAHHCGLSRSSKVVLHYLPVASPELNSVERFFEEIRKPLSNRIFKNISEVEIFLCRMLQMYYKSPKLIVQLCFYPYMLYAKPK